MLQYSKAPVQAPFGDPPGRRPGQAARSASYGCRRGWPGGGKHLPSGRPPMDCGICRPFRAGGERKVLRRETGVLAAHFVAAAGGVFPSRGRRRSAGPGGGRLKVGEPEAKRTRWRPKPCGEGRPTRRGRRCVLGGRQLPRHVLKAGQRTGGTHPPGKRGSSLQNQPGGIPGSS